MAIEIACLSIPKFHTLALPIVFTIECGIVKNKSMNIVQSLLNVCLMTFVLRSSPNHAPIKHRCLMEKILNDPHIPYWVSRSI
jgi:hypothetical protein